MTDHKATPEQWDALEKCSHAWPGAWGPCILELRARVEVLEAAAHKHIVETSANILALASRVEALEAAKRPASKVYEINEPLQLTPNSKPAVKGPLLITRVAATISQDGKSINWSGAYAAIREVAAWLSTHGHPAAADALEVMEAKR